MKKTILLLAMFVGGMTVSGQGYGYDNDINTIFGDDRITHGGYGAISIMYSQIDGKDALVMGGRGSWVIGHAFAFGIGGTGFINDFHFNSTLGLNANLAGGYGGLVLEPAAHRRQVPERGLFGEESPDFEIRVDTRFDPAEKLEDQLIAQHDRRVTLAIVDGAHVDPIETVRHCRSMSRGSPQSAEFSRYLFAVSHQAG